MQEVGNVLALQHDAYCKGIEFKQAHLHARCVLRGAQLLALAGDYAITQLFRETQRQWEIRNLHERAGLRMRAFRMGYEGQPLAAAGRAAGASGRRSKRRPGRYGHARSQEI
jgi:hypothetical protein